MYPVSPHRSIPHTSTKRMKVGSQLWEYTWKVGSTQKQELGKDDWILISPMSILSFEVTP
eukprot:15359731-Ditylum_brightwellii.AAC.2